MDAATASLFSVQDCKDLTIHDLQKLLEARQQESEECLGSQEQTDPPGRGLGCSSRDFVSISRSVLSRPSRLLSDSIGRAEDLRLLQIVRDRHRRTVYLVERILPYRVHPVF